jgi:hypothetical protein
VEEWGDKRRKEGGRDRRVEERGGEEIRWDNWRVAERGWDKRRRGKARTGQVVIVIGGWAKNFKNTFTVSKKKTRDGTKKTQNSPTIWFSVIFVFHTSSTQHDTMTSLSRYNSFFTLGNKEGRKNRTISAPLEDTQWLTLFALFEIPKKSNDETRRQGGQRVVLEKNNDFTYEYRPS